MVSISNRWLSSWLYYYKHYLVVDSKERVRERRQGSKTIMEKPAPLEALEHLGKLLREGTVVKIPRFEELETQFGKVWLKTQRYIERLTASRDIWKKK